MFKHDNDARIELAIFVGLLTIAAVTRVYGLPQWHLIADEYYTYAEAAKRFTALINPAYYFLTVVSFEVFAVSEWAARWPVPRNVHHEPANTADLMGCLPK